MADEAIDESLKAMDKIDQLSHPEVMALFSNKLAEIMKDPLLIGLPNEPTLDEVNSQIALEHGRAMIVNVRQQDELNTILRKYTKFALFKVRKERNGSTVKFSKGLQRNCLYMGIHFGRENMLDCSVGPFILWFYFQLLLSFKTRLSMI